MIRVKKTTADQFALLFRELEKNPELLKHTPVSCRYHNRSWEKITEKLNAIGPPTRNLQEWKRVFYNLKVQTNRKMAKIEEVGFLTCPLSEKQKRMSKILKPSGTVKPSGETFRVSSIKSYPPFTSNSRSPSPTSDIPVEPTKDASTPITHFTTSTEKRKADDQSNSLFRRQLQHQVKYKDLSTEMIDIMDRQSICLHKLINTVERQEVLMERQLELLEKQTLAIERHSAALQEMT